MRELDLSAIRARLASQNGPKYWRSLDELAETPEFADLLHREFPEGASEFTDPAGRRQFLKLMGASLALAGVTGCTRQPTEMIVPYVKAPEEIIPGKPLWFATAMPHGGFATPVLAESHMGRPTKIEPNPQHPATRGGTDVYAQASILTLYDPDRSKTIKFRDEIHTWGDFTSKLGGLVAAQKALGGAGFRLLTETITSPTLASQIDELLKSMPAAKWVQYDAVGRENVRDGAKAALGQDADVRYRFDQADIVLLLDSDVLESDPGRLRYSRDFADRRRLVSGKTDMNRVYAVDSRVGNTGSKSDHRVAVRAVDVENIARAVAAGIGVAGVSGAALPASVPQNFVSALVKDLQAHKGRSLVVAGDQQPASVHHLAHLMNAALGAVGQTLEYSAPVAPLAPAAQQQTIVQLAQEMGDGKVEVLVILSANPVYTAPADLKFVEKLAKVPNRIHLGLFEDETAEQCHWHIPESHFLESWGDVRTFDGTVTIAQPLIDPIWENNKAAVEVLAALLGNGSAPSSKIVRDFWEKQYSAKSGAFGPLNDPDGQAFPTFDKFFRRALHDGYIAGSALPALTLTASGAAPAAPAASTTGADAIEITFSADPTVYDGRFANNGWLQETPKPFNKITWDNAALINPETAKKLQVEKNQVIELKANGLVVKAAVWVQPGQPLNSINLTLGYGRTKAGQVGNGAGYNAYPLRTSDALWQRTGVEVAPTREWVTLASAQGHFSVEGRDIIRAATLNIYKSEPDFAQHIGHKPDADTTLHGNPWKYEGNAWGMTIDLNACNGCNACVVACVSENNIPVVGREQVARGREMSWIRIDRYYEGDPINPKTYDQPMACVQCENAPCEVVCPVAATVHSTEGLNDMVYNRCVGTRYCANNCPYKARRFNFLLYADWTTPTLKMARNPDVTVRSRGVMEKCTYCVQRINQARIQSKLEDRAIKDGEITPACASACPTDAIVFGNINDPESRVAAMKKEPRNYGLLEELNTRPRTTYLAAVRNPNPELEPEGEIIPKAHYHAPTAHGAESGAGHGAAPAAGEGH
jgi:molybdopterin-containing oxidoreductase family iron-sulfur binding subunit